LRQRAARRSLTRPGRSSGCGFERIGGWRLGWRCIGRARLSGAFCEELFEFLARLEVRHSLGRNVDRFASLGVSAAAWSPLTSAEAPKAPQFDLFTLMQRADYRAKNGFDNHLGIALVQLRRASHFFNKFCLSHRSPVLPRSVGGFASDMNLSACLLESQRGLQSPNSKTRS